MRLIQGLILLSVQSVMGVVELTSENFKSEMAGKNAFVKFFAPWSVISSIRKGSAAVFLLYYCLSIDYAGAGTANP
jgi:hypothetical protein